MGGKLSMVDVIRIDNNGFLLEIKEVSDKYRDILYNWDDD